MRRLIRTREMPGRHEFGEPAIPLIVRHMKLFGPGVIALRILVFHGMSRVVLF
jgi:hypothetical protein